MLPSDPLDPLLTEERRLKKAFLPVLLLASAGPLAALACTRGVADDGVSLGSQSEHVADGGAGDLPSGACAVQDAEAPATSDAGDCADYKVAPCGLPPSFVSLSPMCNLSISQCAEICGRQFRPCEAYGDSCVDGQVVQDRPVTIECAICPGTAGRRPEGFDASPSASAGPPLGAFFAELARLEAASIDAFDRLRDELALHDAPDDLVRAAERARRDEVAHTRVMTRLARRHGGTATRVTRSPRRARPLAAIARENMVEGCIRETFGALVAAWQAARASDPEIAQALQGIARDELRHAALSWAVARFCDTRLGGAERDDIARAARAAIAELRTDAYRPLHPELVAIAGVPSGSDQRRMIDELETSLWAA
jgi:hypothetical protein